MAQQDINIGVANAKTGDTYFDAFTKVQSNFDDLYGNNTVYLTQESDLPNQTATTWTMDPNVPYKLTASFSTNLQCIPAAGASFRGDNLGSYTMSYTGAGSMFKGTDVDFFINNVSINPGATNTAFEFDDTVGSVRRFICANVEVVSCGVFGIFTDMSLTQVSNSNCLNAGDGLRILGTNNRIISITQLALISSSAGFKGIDLGSSSSTVTEFNNLFFVAPAGAFGISGLVSNGNIPVGRLAMVNNCEFLGGMTDLENISVDNDIRWRFRDNNPTPDTFPDALISFRNNATETVIAASSTDGSNAVLVAGTWIEQQVSFFDTTVAGRVTYLAERLIKAPVDVSVGLISSGGGGITVTVYLAFDGVVDVSSGVDVAISGSTAQTLAIPWQTTFIESGYMEVYVENNTNTTNIIVDHAILRVL